LDQHLVNESTRRPGANVPARPPATHQKYGGRHGLAGHFSELCRAGCDRLVEPDRLTALPPAPPRPPTTESSTEGTALTISSGGSHASADEDIEDWLSFVDQVLQGLHHALNNRIGTLSALIELAELSELPADGSAFKAVTADLARLGECNHVIDLLRRDTAAGEEPLMVDDVLTDAYAIHRYLHDVRDVQVTAGPTRAAEPVRVHRWVLVRTLSLLLYDARHLAKRLDRFVVAGTDADAEWVRVSFRVDDGVGRSVDDVPVSFGGHHADVLAGLLGGNVFREPGAVGVRLPTLKARREREAALR
jgi:hypothetical protein